VRELENIIERGVALCDGEVFGVDDLPQELKPAPTATDGAEPLVSLEELERRHIARVLESTGRNKSLAAQILDVPRTTLWRKLKQFNLD
jgi:transcriptional regulator of acetoin/glycerol metabolism